MEYKRQFVLPLPTNIHNNIDYQHTQQTESQPEAQYFTDTFFLVDILCDIFRMLVRYQKD